MGLLRTRARGCRLGCRSQSPPVLARSDPRGVGGHAIAANGVSSTIAMSGRTSAVVLGRGHRLHVGGIHARWRAAQVVDVETVGDRPDQQLVGVAVGIEVVGEPAVSVTHDRSSPEPASLGVGLVDSLPELLNLRRPMRGAAAAPPFVVDSAPPTSDGRTTAVVDSALLRSRGWRVGRSGLAPPTPVGHAPAASGVRPIAAFDRTRTLGHLGPPTRFGQDRGAGRRARSTHPTVALRRRGGARRGSAPRTRWR